MTSQRFWTRGETIMHRQVAHADGNVVGWPHVVVEDGAERSVLYQPEGAPFLIWNLDEQRFLPQFSGAHVRPAHRLSAPAVLRQPMV